MQHLFEYCLIIRTTNTVCNQFDVRDDEYVLEYIANALDPNAELYQVASVFGFVFVNETNTIVAGQVRV